MVKVKEGPMAEAQQPTTHHPQHHHQQQPPPVLPPPALPAIRKSHHQQLLHRASATTANPTNNNHHHHSHTHHIHQHYTTTYFHHHCGGHPGEGGGGGGGDAPAKFHFGPGFEAAGQGQRGGGGGGGGEVGGRFCPAAHGNQAGAGNEYVVLFHINPGVTINFQIGDSVEILRGPVTVPMVSTNSTPPIAMPVQVPPGHVVQQIVDESGTLRHVILSPQPTGLVPLTSHNAPHYGGGPGNSTNPPQQTFYQGMPAGFPPAAHYHSNMPPGHPAAGGGPPNHPPGGGHSPNGGAGNNQQQPAYYKDERTQRQYVKLKKKYQDKQKLDAMMRKELVVNGLRKQPAKEKDMNSVGTSEDGEESSSVPDEEDSVQIIADVLSSVQAPKVSDLSSRSALLQWAPPTKLSEPPMSSAEGAPDIDKSELRYEVLLSDKSKEMKFKSIYNGTSLSCRIQDLRPGQEYSVCLQVHYEELQGSASDPLKFTTPPCEPDKPQAPKLGTRLKNSLQLKWTSTNDNGAPIGNYVLEFDEGRGGDEFVEFHKGRTSRQYTLNKLKPATAYRFRLAAINDVGRSDWSDVVTYTTLNNPPSKPAPPTLLEATVDSLELVWGRRPTDESFLLQANDGGSTNNYLPVYTGTDTRYLVTQLLNYEVYKFRLRSRNDGGDSPWSDEVVFRTLPDRPMRPSKPVVKGRIHAHSFKLKWEPPLLTGGADITAYLLEVNSGSGYEAVYSGSETEAVCDKLTPGTTYQLRVSCVSAGGPSNYSDPCTVTTDAIAPGQCSQPRLTAKPKSTSLAVRWTEPDYNGGAPVLEYELEMADGDDDICEVVQKSKDTECVVGGLRPGCEYYFQVRAVNRIGPGPWSDRLRVSSGAAAPETPDAPTTVCRSAVHVFVEWNEPANNGAALGDYCLELSTRDQEEEFRPAYQGPERSYDVKGLTPFTTYYFRVQATNAAGASPFSPVAATITPAAPPATVTTLRHEATPNTITLSWTEPADNGSPILHYSIEVGDKGVFVTDGPANQYVIENLNPDTSYKIKIQAVNQIGTGGLSPTLRASTLRLPPTAPRLECIATGHNYLKLKWGDGRNADYTQYTVEMERGHHEDDFQCVYKGTAFAYKVNKLHELTAYRFRICASNDTGTGAFSPVHEFRTGIALPGPVKQPRLAEVEQRTCAVEWTASRNAFGDAVVYKVQVGRASEQALRQAYLGPDTKCSITDLEPGVEYQARVCAVRVLPDCTDELAGPYSPMLHFTTAASETAPPSKAAAGPSAGTSGGGGGGAHHHKHRGGSRVSVTLAWLRANKALLYAVLILIVGIVISEWILWFFL